MQTNLFSQEDINKESGVGELLHNPLQSKEELNYLKYPGLDEIIQECKKNLSENKKIKFKSKKIFNNNPGGNFVQNNKDSFDGLMASPFSALFTQNICGQKVLGQYSLAYIEAKATNLYHQKLFGDKQAIDHFYFAQGISNISVLEELLKSYELPSNCPAIILIPDNAIKAFHNTAYSNWQITETKTQERKTSAYKINKISKEKEEEIKLSQDQIQDIDFPIYKVKAGDTWVIAVPIQSNLDRLYKNIELELSSELIDSIQKQKKEKLIQVEKDELVLETSLGQAARAIFELTGADFDLLPEIMINFEGGSWTSITQESSSTGRYNGTNSMHEVLQHAWYKHNDIAIPWFYLGFDLLTDDNKKLLESEDVFLLNFANQEYLEAPQNWKKISLDLIQYVLKFIYREYSNIGSKKFLLSTKELMQTAAKFLANWNINNANSQSEAYKQGLKDFHILPDLTELLEILAYAHMLSSCQADFYSCKTNPHNIKRLKHLAIIQKKLDKLSPISAKNFSRKIYALLSKDIKSESTTLLDLYQEELNKI